ncbi:hypothetical protein [Undibacterium terreum]|uniref:OmpA family protein n=1 Tax=Undibacterium terreum TaxID=1224302 RepID=A0A916UAI8_9BURK|nr:hypothetical protein [Undibacterium terreum]GGC64632.1 hypothetical protein GCM10011396_09530 [Undibacterium terreum]
MTKKSLLLVACALFGAFTYSIDGYCAGKENSLLTAQSDIYKLLQHGKLGDARYLSEELGFGLKISPPNYDSTAVFEARFYSIPDYLFANGLTYHAYYDEKSDTTRIDLALPFQSCPSLDAWASDWGQPVQHGMLEHALGSFNSITWPSPEKITLDITYFNRGGCRGYLQQIVKGKLLPPVQAEARTKSKGDGLAQSVADILATGDLRNFEKVAAALNARVIPSASNRDPENGEYFDLAKPILGLDSNAYSYAVNDTGWFVFTLFEVKPRHLAERWVTLNLAPNLSDVCLPASDIKRKLDQGMIPYSYRQEKYNEISFSVRGEHLISLKITSSGECVARIRFKQITDIANNLSSPVVFSLDALRPNGLLNAAALQRMDILARHLHTPKFRTIYVYLNLPDSKTNAQVKKGQKLAIAIRNSLIARGISQTQIDMRGDLVAPSLLAAWNERQLGMGVFLDPTSDF